MVSIFLKFFIRFILFFFIFFEVGWLVFIILLGRKFLVILMNSWVMLGGRKEEKKLGRFFFGIMLVWIFFLSILVRVFWILFVE